MKKIVVILIVGFLSSGIISHHDSSQHIYFLKSKLFNFAGKVYINTTRMTAGQLNQLANSIQPGDIFLTRKPYHLTNLGIPGFWTHACSYIGSPNERTHFFSDDINCVNWVKSKGEDSGSLESLLQKKFPFKYLDHTGNGISHPIVESMGDGVIFSSYSKLAAVDRIVILRPQVTKLEIAKAIYHSFEMAGRPYDYNFDFSTESAIACSELVYHIYRESKLFAINHLLGNPFTTPNEIAMEYDEKFNSNNLKLKMILLFDRGNLYDSKSTTGQTIFRQSWKRSFW